MTKKEILPAIIIGYRNLINERYAHAEIAKNYEIPPSFTEARTAMFRNYFLHHLYPAPDKRQELDEAFQNLDSYIKNPEKLFRILIDSVRLIFKYGRHLPKILQAGLKALKSFRAATQMEQKLVESAITMSMPPPYAAANIKTLLATLSKEDLDNFIDNNQALFETLQDRNLVKKIVEIVEYLIAKMKSRPQIYSIQEINALTVGRDIIQQGDLLFDQLTVMEQESILELTLRIERDFLEGLH